MAEEKNYSKKEREILNRSVDEVITVLKQEMKEQFGFWCTGRGVSMPYDIQEIEVDFLCHQKVTIEEARELEIRATERFVEIINSHEAIRPYLRDYPWDHRRAAVMIAFRNEYGEGYPDGLRLVFQSKDEICYFSPKKSPKEVGPSQREPYEEAKKIVNSTPSCLKSIESKLEEKPVEKKKK
ncbi:MAG: hypothetical protein K2Y01_07750 [Rhabdochlamydiaceae bacterium]|nr:hypothetical protein [Rhabdochlamydiaceae bacterium]